MCTENDEKNNKLCGTIQELRSMLEEATVRYGELETKHNTKLEAFKEEIEKRDECIQHLKRELQDANELLEAAKRGRLLYCFWLKRLLQFFLHQFFHFPNIIQCHPVPLVN